MWWALAILAEFERFAFEGRSAVGGSATCGWLGGIVISFFQLHFEWSIVGKAIVIVALIGYVFEVGPRIMDRFRQVGVLH